MSAENKAPEFGTKELVAEFIGTYILVLTVGCNVLGGSGTWAALSIASSLMVCVYSLASVSGAAFNPAVIFACKLADDTVSWGKVAAYSVVEIVAGCLAGATYMWVHGKAFQLEPGTNFNGMQAGAVEALYTFMLCFVVLRTAGVGLDSTKHAPNEYFGLAIGFVIVAGGYAGGWISKGAFNPAVAIGVDVASAGQGVYWCAFYTVAELVGATLAAVVHNYFGNTLCGDKDNQMKKMVSEFIGTFFLVLTVGLNVLGQSPAPALSIGASLMCMIYALGAVSGAHFNPAVTVALMIAKKDGSSAKFDADHVYYFGGQLLGGLAAALVYSGLAGASVPLGPGAGHGMSAAAFAEIIYTFVLCFTVLNVATPDPQATGPGMANKGAASTIFGLAIGFCVVVGGYAIGSVSGGSLNPAVSFALDTSHAMKGGSWMNCLTYTAFELVGAGLAGVAYNVCRPAIKSGLLPIVSKSYGAI